MRLAIIVENTSPSLLFTFKTLRLLFSHITQDTGLPLIVRFSPIRTSISPKDVVESDEDRFLTSSSVVAGAYPRSPFGCCIISPAIPMRENTVSFFSEGNLGDARVSSTSFGLGSTR